MSLRRKIGDIDLLSDFQCIFLSKFDLDDEKFLSSQWLRTSLDSIEHLSLTSWILPLEEGGAILSSGDPCRENLDSFFNQTQSWSLIFPIRGSESSSCLLWLSGKRFSDYSILSVHPSMSLRSRIGAIHLFRDSDSNDGMESRDLILDPFSTSFDVTQEQDRCHSSFP